MTRVQALTDIFLAMLLTLVAGRVAAMLGLWLMETFGAPFLLVAPLQGALILLGLNALLRYREHSWRQMGLRPFTRKDVSRALLALALVFALNASLILLAAHLAPGLVEVHRERLGGMAAALGLGVPVGLLAVAMLFVGFYEELLARGFLLQRARRLLGGTWGPVLLSSLLFGLGHFYQSWIGVVQTMMIGILLARLTLYWGTLWPAILAHAALNTLAITVLLNADLN